MKRKVVFYENSLTSGVFVFFLGAEEEGICFFRAICEAFPFAGPEATFGFLALGGYIGTHTHVRAHTQGIEKSNTIQRARHHKTNCHLEVILPVVVLPSIVAVVIARTF